MNTENNSLQDHVDTITDDAHSLIAATANATDAKVSEARNRLTAALKTAKQTAAVVQKKAIAGAKATDHAIRENPYQAIGIAFGVGALLGFLLTRRGRD